MVIVVDLDVESVEHDAFALRLHPFRGVCAVSCMPACQSLPPHPASPALLGPDSVDLGQGLAGFRTSAPSVIDDASLGAAELEALGAGHQVQGCQEGGWWRVVGISAGVGTFEMVPKLGGCQKDVASVIPAWGQGILAAERAT